MLKESTTFLATFSLCCFLLSSCANEFEYVSDAKSGSVEGSSKKNKKLQLLLSKSCYTPCTLALEAPHDARKVTYFADQGYLGESTDAASNFAISYDFARLGAYQVRAIVTDGTGSTIGETRSETTVWGQLDDDGLAIQVGDECSNPCKLSVSASIDAETIEYFADGYLLGSSTDSNARFAITYDFHKIGQRVVTAQQYDADDQLIAEHTKTVFVRPGEGQRLEVPYRSQYDNEISPLTTCQNTALAMMLNSRGWQGTPDDISSDFGTDTAKSPTGFAHLYNRIAQRDGLIGRLEPELRGSFREVKHLIDSGSPVAIHGFFTQNGHLVVITDYDEDSYTVHDPAGVWNESFAGGYGTGAYHSGANVVYERNAFERAVGTLNGYDFEPLWFSAFR